MQFDSLSAFLNMGGHAQYVWLAYGSAVVVCVTYTVTLLRTRNRVFNELRWLSSMQNETVHEEVNEDTAE